MALLGCAKAVVCSLKMQHDLADFTHEPVLLNEVLEMLDAKKGGVYVDATLGLGGHTEAILAANDQNVVIGLDQDGEAIRRAAERLRPYGKRFRAVHANFSAIASLADVESADGLVADLGVSSMQLDDSGRGFSFRADAPLDMRMDTDTGVPTAADLLAEADESEIADIIYRFGEERHSRRIARRIVEKRNTGEPVKTTRELAELVRKAIGRGGRERVHPATRTFQALRIAVNNEIEIIRPFIHDSIRVLKPSGILAVITFHSLEDRVVKREFQLLSGKCQCPPRMPQCMCGAEKKVELLTKKPIVPSGDEIDRNARSRSAKLRVCRKVSH